MSKSSFLIGTLIFIIVGIFLGDTIHIDLWWQVGIIIGLAIALIILWREIYWRMVLLILIGFTIGLAYFNLWDIHQKKITLPYNEELSIQGQIIGHPDFSGSQANYVLKYQKTKIRLTTGRYPEYHYGDVLKFKAIIKEPYPYFFHQGILGQIYNPEKIEKIGNRGNIATGLIYKIRDKFEESLNKSLSEPYSSFAAGLVLGSKRNIPDSLISDLNRTGTTHIIAVSGYNVTIMVIYLGLFLGIFSRKLKFWGSLVIILGFVVMTGAPASVVRAGLLAGLVALGHYEGRRINMTILLSLVAVVMLLFNPYALKFDLSFQLSFLAFAGLVYLSPVISDLKIIKLTPEILKSPLSETIGAQIMVLPILVYSFGRLSILSPIVNVLILWIVPLSMGLIFAVGIAGLIWANLGQVVGYLGWLVLKYIIVVIESFSKIPWASSELKLNSWWWMPVYFAIVILFILRRKKNEIVLRT